MPNSYRVGLGEALEELGLAKKLTKKENLRRLYGLVFLVFAADVACAGVLFWSTDKYRGCSDEGPCRFQWRGFKHFIDEFAEYHTATVDLIVLCFVRILLFPLFTLIAINVGTLPTSSPKPEAAASNGNLQDEDGDNTQPLLLEVNDGTGKVESDARTIEKRCNFRRNTTLMLFFLFNTMLQVYVGVKCVSFGFKDATLQGLLMASSIFLMNLAGSLMKKVAIEQTKEEGHLVPEFHPHRLYFDDNLVCHWCDLCRTKCPSAYRCKLCDFDACVKCFERKDRTFGESVLRGDKGIKKEENVTGARYIGQAWSLAKPQSRLLIIAFTCLTINSAASLMLPNYQGKILDFVVLNDRASFASHVMIYLGLSIILGLFGAVRSLCFNIIGRRIANTIREKLFKKMIIQDIAFFDGYHTGNLTSRLSNDANGMVAPIQTTISTLLSNTISLIGGVAMCFFTSWRLSLMAFTTVLPVMHCTEVYAVWSQRLNRQIYAALGEANSVAVEALGNIRTVRAFSTEPLEIDKYLKWTQEALKNGVQDAWGGAGMFAINNYLDLGAGILILWYGGLLALDHENFTVGRLITYQLYWNMLNNSYKVLIDIVTQFTRAAGAAQRVLSLMDNIPDIDPEAGDELVQFEGELRFVDVRFHYQMRPDQPVLSGVNLTIDAGTVCALVGRSGGGKSTMVHMLLRFYDPKEGEIQIDGKNLTSLNLRSVHKHIGIVAQDTQLFANTIRQNIAYGLEEGSYTDEDIFEAARQAFAHDFITGFPEGYDTRCGERGVRLSGGQKQRIAIARVFLRRPRMLFLDEATSALDTESEALVQEALDKLILLDGVKRTVVLVAHRLSTVMNADKIAVIDKGRVVEEGNHDKLVDAGGVYSKLVSRQIAKQASTLDDGDEGEAVVGEGGGAAGKGKASGKAVDSVDGLLDEIFGARQYRVNKAVTQSHNMRAQPNARAKVVGKLAAGDVVDVIKQERDWLQIEIPTGEGLGEDKGKEPAWVMLHADGKDYMLPCEN
jgi:ABC-type multidrug transport system fused ATPase/permease subunit